MFTSQWRKWLVGVLALQSILSGVVVTIWVSYPRYIPTWQNVTYSLDSRFFVEERVTGGIPSVNIGRISDGWRETTFADYHGAYFYAWSAHSRFAVVVFYQHYGVTDLGIFDTWRWQWNSVSSCMDGAMSACTTEVPLAMNGRFLYLWGGAMIDLTSTSFDGYRNWESQWIGIYTPQKAAWSADNRHLAIVGSDENGSRALYVGDEAGLAMRAVIPLDAYFAVSRIFWNGSEVTVTGSLNETPMSFAFNTADE